jgi:hypothetical protein
VIKMEDVETKIYRECPLCCNIINPDHNIPRKFTYYLWIGNNVYVCRSCAKKLLRNGEPIVGISVPRGKELYIKKQ